MFWSRKPVEFSNEDTRLFLEIALPQLVHKLGEPVYIVNNENLSLISESHLRKRVETLLANATTVLNTTEIATQLRVSRSAVDRVISAAIATVAAFSDGVHVLPAKRLAAISNELTTISTVSEICVKHQITIKAVEHIVKLNSEHLTRVGEVIVPNKELTAHLQAFQAALTAAETPVKYADLEKDKTLLALIKTKLEIPHHKLVYFPDLYIRQREQEAATILAKNGFASNSLVAEFTDPTKFAKTHMSVVVGSYIVQSQFIAAQLELIQQNLSQKWYFDLRDLPLGPEFANYLVSGDAKLSKLRDKSKRYPANYLVHPQLEKDWLERVLKQTLATLDAKVSKVSLDSLNGTSTSSEFVDLVELPSLVDIEAQIPESVLPTDLQIAQHIWPTVRQTFRQQAAKAMDIKFAEAQLRLEAQIGVYLNGVCSLVSTNSNENSELVSMAWQEWQQYVSDRQYNVPSTLEIAQQMFKPSENPLLMETRQILVEKLLVKLDKSLKSKKKDAALTLHLASAIYHAAHYCPEGLLKIRGKAVPKLLKRFEFPLSFTELKTSIKAPSMELLETVASEARYSFR